MAGRTPAFAQKNAVLRREPARCAPPSIAWDGLRQKVASLERASVSLHLCCDPHDARELQGAEAIHSAAGWGGDQLPHPGYGGRNSRLRTKERSAAAGACPLML